MKSPTPLFAAGTDVPCLLHLQLLDDPAAGPPCDLVHLPLCHRCSGQKFIAEGTGAIAVLRHCFYFPCVLCRQRQHRGLCRQRTTPTNKDIVFIFQVFCADKDNIEDVRSGSEAEVDSESDNPRKER